jgi:murein L,D-transpeptidase YcbB/YkuD
MSGAGRRVTIIVIVGLVALLAGGALLLHPKRAPRATVAASVAQPVAPKPVQPPPWTLPQLNDLLAAVKRADSEGLQSSDYNLDALQRDVDDGGTDRSVDVLANAAALSLAHDYSAGRVRNRHRFNWYIDPSGPDTTALGDGLIAARKAGRLKAWLLGLLPANHQYAALRDALAATPVEDWQRRDRIKANLERWRWLPRDFGQGNQLYVNLPRYELDVVRGGQTVATYRAVIGATDMPTPALSAPVRQIIVNPDWIVPQSIVRKSHLRPGVSSRYVFTRRPDGTLRVRQKPGAGNALGKVKIEFPNGLAIYFHDTPSRSLFGASVRTFSHGCVRVQNIDALARSIVAAPERFDAAFAGAQTRGLRTQGRWRANIVYLTLAAEADGALRDVGDPYKLDEPLAAALERRKPRAYRAGSAPAASVPEAAPPAAHLVPPTTIAAPPPAASAADSNGGVAAAAPASNAIDAAMDDAAVNRAASGNAE